MTPEFISLDVAWRHYVITLLAKEASGSRDGDAREIIGASFVLTNPSLCWIFNDRRNLSPYYAAAEILWYASGSADAAMISRYAPQYARFAEQDQSVYGAYGERLGKSIRDVIHVLKTEPNSRRAVVSLWRQTDLQAGHGPDAVKDVPCTLSWQFLVRGNELHMIVDMRSNDIWLGTPYDVFWNCTALRLIANELGLSIGTYTHHVGSLHLYERNYQAAVEAMTEVPQQQLPVWYMSDSNDDFKSLKVAAGQEELARTKEVYWHGADNVIATTLLRLCQDFLSPSYKAESKLPIDRAMHVAQLTFDSNKLKKGSGEK